MNGRMSLAVACAALGMAGCALVDRPELTRFEPVGMSEFRYVARTDEWVYPLESMDAEAERMRWLEMYLKDNAMCASGYEIVSRRPVVMSNNFKPIHDVYYAGRCKG